MTPSIIQPETYWVELCRQEFARRFYHDDCNRVSTDVRRDGMRPPRVVVPGDGVGVSGTTNAERAA